MKNIKKLSITIKDISEGKKEAFLAILHDYENAHVMGDDYEELFDGIGHTIEHFEQKKKTRKTTISA